MRLIVKLFTVVALTTLGLGFVTPTAGADPAGDASQFVSLLNQLRASKGLGPLSVDASLNGMASAWSDHMAAAGTISHNPNLASQAPSNWQTLGENVGMGPTVKSIHDAFVASPHHYENLVNATYGYIGVAVTVSNGTIFVTEDFMGTGSAPAPAPAPVPTAVMLASAPTSGQPGGYRIATGGGQVVSYGATGPLGSASGPTAGMASTPSGRGYWLVSPTGGVFAFGDAPFFGSLGGSHVNQPIVGIASTPDGGGYWLVARDGGVFAFGNAGFHGSTGNLRLSQPIVAVNTTPSGQGYRLTAADGGVFNFGDAGFFGSTGNLRLNQPITGMAVTPAGDGYWLVARDGGVFAFGKAPFYGSTGNLRLNQPIAGITSSGDGRGYRFVAADGGVFSFGNAPFYGSAGSVALGSPVVGIAPGD
jgi:hypothetical protein